MDGNETFLGLGNVGSSEEAQAKADATAPEVATPATEEGAQGSTPAGENAEAEGKPEAKDLEVGDLTDEQFEKLIAKLTSDEKSPFNKNKAWQRIISQRDGYSNKTDTMLKRLAQANPQLAREVLLDDGVSEDEVNDRLIELGADLSKTTPKAETDTGLEDKNEFEFLSLLKGMGVDYNSITPEQRDFWKFQFQFNRKMMQPIQDFMSKSESDKQKQEHSKREEAFTKEENELKELCTNKYALKWENEVVPELRNYLKEHPKFMGTPKQLFYVVAGEMGWLEDLGKRAKTVEDAKATEEKKRMNSENAGSSGKGSAIPVGVGKKFSDTWDFVNRQR